MTEPLAITAAMFISSLAAPESRFHLVASPTPHWPTNAYRPVVGAIATSTGLYADRPGHVSFLKFCLVEKSESSLMF